MDNIENLMLEHLKRFQATLERVENKVDELIIRVGHLEVAMGGVKRDVAHIEETQADLSVRVDKLAGRLERVEKRLELQ